jgi:ankyrin repeat protein
VTDSAASEPAVPSPERDLEVQRFFRLVGTGVVDDVRVRLDAEPGLVAATAPHPFWGGRPQALHVAVESGVDDTFDLLLARGASPDGVNDAYAGWSPLMLAAQRGRARMRDTLLARGARVGLVEALLLADDVRLDVLLAAGADIHPGPAPSDGSLLMFARTPHAIERLLALGVDPHRRDRWGTSPIEALSRLGAAGAPLVAMLVQRRVPAPLDVYARVGDLAALEGAAAYAPQAVAAADVMLAAVDARQHAVVRWLLAHGASANARAAAQSRQTALHDAAWHGDQVMVEILLAAGADPLARDDEHDATPRGWAETSHEITRNPAAAGVAAYLASIGG